MVVCIGTHTHTHRHNRGRQYITLSDGHVVETAKGKGCIGTPQQGEGIGQQGRGVGVVCRVGVTLQESLRSGHGQLLFLTKVMHTTHTRFDFILTILNWPAGF